jgi:hypothetical protein
MSKSKLLGKYLRVGRNFDESGERSIKVALEDYGRARIQVKTYMDDYNTKIQNMNFKILDKKIKDGELYVKLGGLSHGYKERIEHYEFSSISRLDRGFNTLMNHLIADGVSKLYLEDLRTNWAKLSDKEKGEIFTDYNRSALNKQFGSDTLDISVDVHASADEYAMTLADLIDAKLGYTIGV